MGLEIKCETKLYIIIIILYCSGNADEKSRFFFFGWNFPKNNSCWPALKFDTGNSKNEDGDRYSQ